MSLYLGSVGRKLIQFTVNRPRLNRVVDGFGFIANRITLGAYTSGLTRESYILYQRTLSGDRIDIKSDGFYREGNKIAGNEQISNRIRNNGLPSFVRTKDDTPETIARYCRTNVSSDCPYSKEMKRMAISSLLLLIPDLSLKIYANINFPPSTLSSTGYESVPDSLFIINQHHYINNTLAPVIILSGGFFLGWLLYTHLNTHFSNKLSVPSPVYKAITIGALLAGSLSNLGELALSGYVTNYLNFAVQTQCNLADIYVVGAAAFYLLDRFVGQQA